uniref:Uncharacterized protein n=1 Tax=Leptocylindrus danicus TaxID=163516 RepID=A0A7S2LTZ5_9STRA|mmetsp:Transcript_9421/g.14170  ORF Transcript_9421/g.14170 Transcript_9421/m.14170 type:complete len:360 (+) Transcript_9421:2686-3765(+)
MTFDSRRLRTHEKRRDTRSCEKEHSLHRRYTLQTRVSLTISVHFSNRQAKKERIMKIYYSLFALSAVAPAMGFVANKAPATFSTALNVGGDVNGYGPSTLETRAFGREGSIDSRINDLEARRGMPSRRGGAGLWDERTTLIVQGNTLKTWSYASPAIERVQVALRTEGRPLDADVELWQGPDNTPVRMRVYVENGSIRPFNAVIETPRGPNTIAVRNIGQVEFPLTACVTAEDVPRGPQGQLSDRPSSLTIQGGALKTYPFDPAVESVQVLLKTDGRPLNARLELLQGPNNNKQVIELYTEDGLDRPFYAIIETPGSGNVVRIVNTAPVEFPMSAWVEPYFIDENASSTDVVLGGDRDW